MTHTDIINRFIDKNGYQSYLEIGVFNRDHNFNKINCRYKYCIDPDLKAEADFFGTSDEFFKANNKVWDLIFLDGLHVSTQLYKDILNSLVCLGENGVILVHDLLPPNKKAQEVPRVQGEWTGDCWMAFVWLRATRPDLFMYTINTDYGVGVIQPGQQELITISENITYENFERNKTAWLNLRHPLAVLQ
jgi:hypothetical protein